MSEDIDKGKAVFEKLSEEDRRALKRFLTGQIQNILANEHGIGGSANAAVQKEIIRKEIAKQVELKFSSPEVLRNVVEESIRLTGRGTFVRVVEGVLRDEIRNAFQGHIREAVERICLDVFVKEKTKPETEHPNFGVF